MPGKIYNYSVAPFPFEELGEYDKYDCRADWDDVVEASLEKRKRNQERVPSDYERDIRYCVASYFEKLQVLHEHLSIFVNLDDIGGVESRWRVYWNLPGHQEEDDEL